MTSAWELLQSGASDACSLETDAEGVVRQIRARFERWLGIEALLESRLAGQVVLGKSSVWRAALCRIVEIARFSDTATRSSPGKAALGKSSSTRNGSDQMDSARGEARSGRAGLFDARHHDLSGQASSSATSVGRSREPYPNASAAHSLWPMAARCFLTRSVNSICRCSRRNCCA